MDTGSQVSNSQFPLSSPGCCCNAKDNI